MPLACSLAWMRTVHSLEAVAQGSGCVQGRRKRKGEELGLGEQRTLEWHAEREHRLTASAFGNALG